MPTNTDNTPYDPNAPAVTPTAQASAQAIFAQTLQAYGFSAADIQALTDWAHGQITGSGAPDGQPVPEAQVALNLMQTQQFKNRFPGIAAQQAAGTPVTAPGDYVNYEKYAYATAQAAGLPAGFMSPQMIGNLIANHVDQNELSDRIVKGYQAVAETLPETRAYFRDAFGIDAGHLAAYFLDPTNAEPLLMQKATAAQFGGTAMAAGFHELPSDLLLRAAQMGVTPAEGAQALTGQTATELALTNPLAGRAATQGAVPGRTTGGAQNPELVSEATLASSALIGDAASRRAVQLAQETRKAPFQGGGGYGEEQRGAGVGGVTAAGVRNPTP